MFRMQIEIVMDNLRPIVDPRGNKIQNNSEWLFIM